MFYYLFYFFNSLDTGKNSIVLLVIFLSDLATVEVVCKRGDELLTKTFLLDNGRLKLASLLTVFDLKYVELVLGEFSMLLSWY